MNLSFSQTVIAAIAIVGVVVLGALGKVDGATVIAFLSLICGNALGYVNGKKQAARDAKLLITDPHQLTLEDVQRIAEKGE